MYLDHFRFEEKPFNITPNPRFIFLSKNHREVFAHLLYGVKNHSGFIEVTGEVGTGKTTVLRTLLNELNDDAFRVAFIFNPSLSSQELLRSINREYGLPAEGEEDGSHLSALNGFLLRENAAGRTVVLVIDEAQNLDAAVLEQIRLLSNLETETDKLIQIILVGQPELAGVLEQPGLRQLSQRITVRYHLRPMDFDDTRDYIDHRLEVAGRPERGLFTRAAVKKIFRYSGGLPRLINVLCDRALLVAYTEEAQKVSSALVDKAISELARQGRPKKTPWRMLAASLFLITAILLPGAFLGWLPLSVEEPPVVTPPPPEAAMDEPGRPHPIETHPVDLKGLRQELSAQDEEENARAAFNALARLWNAEEISAPQRTGPGLEFQEAAAERGLQLARFQGGLESLERIDSPAILELVLPGTVGKRFVALTGIEDGQVRISPPLQGRENLSRVELEAIWFGRSYIPWRNYKNLPFLAVPGAKGEGVKELQRMLAPTGVFSGEPTGIFDEKTIESVTRFQASRGVAPDGRVGPITLLLLYQEDGESTPPRLAARNKKGDA